MQRHDGHISRGGVEAIQRLADLSIWVNRSIPILILVADLQRRTSKQVSGVLIWSEFVDTVDAEPPQIQPASVYRSIGILEEYGLLEVTQSGGNSRRNDHRLTVEAWELLAALGSIADEGIVSEVDGNVHQQSTASPAGKVE